VDRAGWEEAAVGRLTSDIEPSRLRDIVSDCLRGDTAPAVALCELLSESDLATTRHVIDKVTQKAATTSRAGDNLVRDRADDLTQLFVETEGGCKDERELAIRLHRTE
jgi:hypothetical protein